MLSINVPARMIEWLEGTQVAADLSATANRPATAAEADNLNDPLAEVLVALREAKSRADGSTTVRLDHPQLEALQTYAGYLADSSADQVSWGDMSALADLNAARTTSRRVAAQLAKLSGAPKGS